ncbi:MAG TPA: FkbM family methyltransferase [Pyrinomonadaceae bacterium]|nr:FkbM family methyltransferase [Pyrinomonadaceae bacterium]
MARSLDYYWKLLQWTLHHYRPEHDVTIETANGLLSCSSRDWLIGKHLFVHRNYELDFIKTSIRFLESEGFLKPGKKRAVADIGANLGMICIALLRENFFEKAIAFEPSPRNFRLLEKNVRQNNFADRIRCFPLALSSENKSIEFEIDETNSGDSRVRKTEGGGELKEHKRRLVSVEAKTFDSFLPENEAAASPREIDLFWIDIQGHEGHFFKGARRFFQEHKVPVINEFWGYGILRSGMTREEYCRVVGETFEKFYYWTENEFQVKSTTEIEKLFDKFGKPREIASIILV